MSWTLRNDRSDKTNKLDSKDAAKEKKSDMVALGVNPEDLTIIRPDGEPLGSAEKQPKPDGGETTAETIETEVVSPEELSKNPIDFLQTVNTEFVNHIQGKPAISKRGFRFIQREFQISTKSEVVQWSEDPLGCVVWAKAELPDGYSAEAHGEGYRFESGVSDNEFVRYADTRAKNRAISDLTSAGALAVSELGSE